ncbi:MAG TPA: HNH endonuclease [Alicyclobacillus sp.]|nr:HNH endonuclease [Alicyclobacillus sp.]
MTTCYLCGTEINHDTWTWEHVLLNSIGGRLKSRDLICRNCNSTFGHDIDSELASQLNLFANLLNISREKGTPPPIYGTTETGNRISLDPGGKPVISKPDISFNKSESGMEIHFKTRNMSEARKILKGLQRTYPQIDIKEILQQAMTRSEYMKERVFLNTVFGGKKAFRAIVKMAVNFYILSGGHREFIGHLIPYIKHGTVEDPVWFFYDHDEEILDQDPNQVIHGLILKGDPCEQILWCYVELFNALRFIVLLNDHYSGDIIFKEYLYDVLQVNEITKRNTVTVNRSKLLNLLMEKPRETNTLNHQLKKLSCIIAEKQRSDHLQQLIEQAVKNTLGSYPGGAIITKEMIKECAREVAERVTPYLLHLWSDEQ